MYWLFVEKGWEPSRWYLMPPGEQDLVWALTSYYTEQKEQARMERQLQRGQPVRSRNKKRRRR